MTQKAITFTLTEMKFLEALRAAGASGVNRNALGKLCESNAEAATDFWYPSNVVDVHIKNLRDKLIYSSEGIETIRGFGYRIKKRYGARYAVLKKL